MDDPHNLERFVAAQAGSYDVALAEIRRGAKRSHWMWFIFPQIAGLGRSDMAVVAWRRLMLKAARDLQNNGQAPLSASLPIDWSQVTAETFTFPLEQSWKDVMPLPENLRQDKSAA